MTLKKEQYLSDLILVTLLDKVWQRIFVAPIVDELKNCFKYEVYQAHTIFGVDKLKEKSHSLNKAFDILISFNDEATTETIETVKKGITNLMEEIFNNTLGLKQFSKALKVYERFGFVPENLSSFYYNLRAKYVQRAFGKDIGAKLFSKSESIACSISNELSLYQMLPEDLHGSYFFKSMQNLMRQEVGSTLTR